MPEKRERKKKKRESRQIFPGRNEESTHLVKEGRGRLHFSTSKLLVRDPLGWHTRESNGKWRHGGDCVPRCRLARYVSNRLQSLHFSPRFLAMIKNVFASRLRLLSVTHTSRRLREFFTWTSISGCRCR